MNKNLYQNYKNVSYYLISFIFSVSNDLSGQLYLPVLSFLKTECSVEQCFSHSQPL